MVACDRWGWPLGPQRADLDGEYEVLTKVSWECPSSMKNALELPQGRLKSIWDART